MTFDSLTNFLRHSIIYIRPDFSNPGTRNFTEKQHPGKWKKTENTGNFSTRKFRKSIYLYVK